MAAEIGDQHPDAQIELIPSSGGRFEVLLDGRAIFQKSKIGRHAKRGEILGLLDKAR
ncbi:MAG: hypothetical protein H0W30_01535 [Gemmatimonadaceae bacterium]|nr:hypothetical protein [Gemmatimonadaceae bacterium]